MMPCVDAKRNHSILHPVPMVDNMILQITEDVVPVRNESEVKLTLHNYISTGGLFAVLRQ